MGCVRSLPGAGRRSAYQTRNSGTSKPNVGHRRRNLDRAMIELAPRVLVADDDPTVAEIVSRYLEREGFRVDTAADGAVALRRALDDPPDLVVLDLMLPGMD